MATVNSDTAHVIFSSESIARLSQTHLKGECTDPEGVARKPALSGEGSNYCKVLARLRGGNGIMTIKNGRCEEESCPRHERF